MNDIYAFLGKDLYKLNSSPTEVSSVVNPSNIDSGTQTGFTELGYGGIKQGKTKFDNTETGFILGIDSAYAKLYMGNDTDYLNWTGTQLIVQGTFNIGGTIITINNTQDIQTYLDLISTAGGGILYLQNGTYTLTADITVPEGVTLQGVSRDGVIIDCNTSYAVKITGSDVYTTGTVTINNGQTTLEGAGGMTWTSAMVGRYVLLDGLWYEITGFTDADTLTIDTYQGDNLAGSAYVISDTNFSATIRNLTVTGATGSGIVVQYAQEPNLNNIVVYGCGTGIEMDYVVFPKLEVTANENGVNLNMNFVEGFSIDFSEFNFSTTGAGVIMVSSRNATFFNSSCNDNTGDGINATSCSKIAFISFDISGNGGQGVEFVSGCNDNQFTDGVIDGNTSDGIKLTATDDRNVLVAISITNNGGYGINIAASTCDNNQVIAPAFNNNTSGNINDSGTDTSVLPEVKTKIVNLSSTNIQNMFATPVEVIPAPGAGNVIVIENVVASYTHVSTSYANGGGVVLEEETSGKNLTDTIMTVAPFQGTSNVISLGLGIGVQPLVANKAVKVTNANNAFTTGDGTLKLSIRYRIAVV